MSTSDGDASSRLDDALADVFATPADGSAGQPAPTWDVDGPEVDDQPYTLPEIVPATKEPPPAGDAAPPPGQTPAPGPAAAIAPATSWSDHMTSVPATGHGAPLRAPGRRPRVRRVTRVLRHIDPWSTFKVALLFSVVAYLVSLTAGVLLWRVADSTGTLDNVERWFTQFGWETFELNGGEIFRNGWIIGLFAAVALTGGLVLLATLFNLVSDIVGGVRMTVLEEEVVERTVSSTRRYVVRRPPTGTAAADWDVDANDPPAVAAPATGTTASTPASPPATDWSVDDDDDIAGDAVERVDTDEVADHPS